MAIVLTISICFNVMQAILFWLFMYSFYLNEKKRKVKEDEQI